jgi:integrase
VAGVNDTQERPMSSVRKAPQASKPPAVDKDFPLWPHPSGRWCRKIKGRFHYFGPWDKPQAALEKWLDQKDDLLAGRKPRPKGERGIDLDVLVNTFLTHKWALVETGELRRSTFDEYTRILKLFLDHFGRNRLATDITPPEFEGLRASLARGISMAELGKRVQLVRSAYKYAVENDILDKAPKFGTFKRPAVKAIRRSRAIRASRMMSADELQAVIAAAVTPLRAMILLAINCGFGQSDLSSMPQRVLDLDKGFVAFPRVKTGVARRCPLWAETVEAIREAIAARPDPLDDEDKSLAFITKYGRRWVRYQASRKKENGGVWVDSVNLQFRKTLKAAKLKRTEAIGFYALRHIHRTIADGAGDARACDIIMGHADENDMPGRYIESVSEDRLRRVTDHIHAWLFAPKITS